MANQYGSLAAPPPITWNGSGTPPPKPAGTIWVPVEGGGFQAMTLAEARAYVPAHAKAFTDPTNQNLSPELRQMIQDPRVQAAIRAGATTKVKVNDTTFNIQNGQITAYSSGSIWKPLLAAGLTAVGGYGLGQAIGVGSAGGAAGAVGTTGGPAAASGGATAAEAAASGVLPSTITVPTATGTIAGLGASGAVPAATAGSSAATAAATAGTAAAATKGISSWLGPLLQYGLPTAGALAGAQIQSTGIKEAAEIQAKSFQKALEYEKQRDEYLKGLESQRYSDLTGRLQPYIAIGQTAGDRMAALLGLNPSGHGYTPPQPAAMQNTGILPTTQPSGAPIIHTMPGARTTGLADQPMPTGTPPMVTMRAPDGTTKVVPATAVDHYRSRGAEVVG